ncbi:hypothetical protein [Anaerospora hongkongensis]|uniref:hypothetical protein n=1 Tax=Anaerospora hongkongensis TaxID=244830 RepID=UPI0028A02125|nr:hypothetical protein [Anaerospora hongkongensis]
MFAFNELAAAFGGGVFAAAVGGLPAFIMCGILVLINNPDMAFGPYFGPHISFAAGVAAAAYAGKKDLTAGNDILTPLIKYNNGPVLVIGGIFGAGGLIIQKLLAGAAVPTDTVALTVGISGIVARLIFGNGKLFGAYTLPDRSSAAALLVLGLGLGLISAYATIVTKNVILGFGIAATSLILVQFMGVGPVTHHLALPAAVAAAATGSLWFGALFGILGAFVGDFVGKTFNSGNTHVDPPAITIAVLTTIVLLFLS